MKQKNYQRWSRPLLLTLLSIFMAFSGASSAWAGPVTETFTSGTNGWAYSSSLTVGTDWGYNSSYAVSSYYTLSTTHRNGSSGTGLCCTESQSDYFIITPFIAANSNVSFYGKKTSSSSSSHGYIVFYKATKSGDTYTVDTSSSLLNWNSNTGNLSTTMVQNSFNVGATDTYIAIRLSRAAIDDMSYTVYEAPASGPGFAVKDGSTKLSSPYAYNFGLATAGTTKTFTLTNPGTAATPIALSTTGNVGASIDEATSIEAGGEVTLTLTMPDADASGTVTVTPTGDGLNPFVFNVSGTKRDANKVYEYGFTSLPEDWSTTGTWYYNASNGAYTTVWYLSSNARLITPKLTIAEGEKFIVEAKGYSTSNTSYQHLQMQYSADGTSWTNFDSEPALDPNVWKTFEFTGAPAGSYYIAINASQADIRMFYGGELPKVAKMVVTQPATLDFGLYDKDADPAPTKTFTIANTGKATLSGISVTSGNAAFTITGAPTSLAAGADAEVTITMSTATAGALSSLITVTATDMEDASFTVTGTVKPAGMPVEDFSGTTIPDGWTSTGSWSFTTDGVAIGTSGTAYLYTPKLKLSAGDFIIIKAKNTDGDASDYITVAGSVNEGTDNYTAYSKKITVANNSDYATFIVTDIPTTINKIRFTGGWVNVDEIHGLTYAPVLAVTKDEAEVNTPAAYDFGECAANATVTYNFANTGGGTINITNVAITGDGAAAYGTNWTEIVAAPFALTITRTYDAGRAGAGAQEAVVTVTTSEGDFVINVTGTDKAANAPELSVTLGEDPVTTGDAANFGTNLKAAPAAKTYTITNSGTGTLTGTIATSDDTQFTVSKTAFSLGAAESTTFDVALVFNTTYGAKAATITIHPTNDGLNDGSHDIIINASASTLDPETWSEDFEGVNPLNGWDNDGFTVKNTAGNGGNTPLSSMMAVSAYGSSYSTLVTPLLIATSGDKLTFDAYFQFGNDPMKVEYSTDGSDWHTDSPLYNFTGSPAYEGKSLNEIEITAPITGEFYLRFTTCYTNAIDNIVGFKLAPAKEHAAIIVSNNIPAAGNQYVEYTATVTVKEKAGKADEVVTAELWIGTNKVATEEDVTLTANDEKEITLSFTPATAMSGDAYIKVYNANIDLTTATQAVAITAALVLDETVAPGELTSGSKPSMVVNYNAKNGWNTICMPFVLTTEILNSIFGTGWQAFEFKSYSDGALGFNSTTTFYAGYPYIIYVETAAVNAEGIKLFNKEIGYSATTANSDTYGGATFQGIYAPIAAGSWPDGAYGVTSDGKIAPGNTTTSYMKGFRAYFTGITAGARLSFFDETTGITTVIDAKELNNDGKVYNLNGQRVENAHKGLYIVNGRKVVVK